VTATQARRRVLILFAHPALQKSRVNVRLAEAVRGLEDVTFHDLYEAYPLLDIDVPREKDLVESHDVLVLQHPFYWYSTPAILKQWQDLVLEHGWAYGSEGTALHGKILLSALSAGGSAEVYCAEGENRFTIRQLLAPFEATARICGMHYPPPFVVHGTHGLSPGEIATHADDYRRLIEALRDGTIDLEAARGEPRLNRRLDEFLRG
jgi:glutathione-regulated potassium-efflux system ancillary protein KefG